MSSSTATSPSRPITSVMATILRLPSLKRDAWTTKSIADITWFLIADSGMSPAPIMTRYSRRLMASRGLFAWTVTMDPGCPVFIACMASSASAPRTSPTTMRSGRIRSAFFNKSRIVISPVFGEGARDSSAPHGAAAFSVRQRPPG